MNKNYALIWNSLRQCWSVGSELSRARGKPGSGSRLLARSLPALALLLTAHVQAANLPDGGNIKAGNGNILVFDNGKQMSINQSSDKLAIDWNSFNIGNGHKVTFNQPNSASIALNRVVGVDGSNIMGQLNANGRVFLVNPNGVLFGKTAQVNVGGLVASTQDLSVERFMAGNYRFEGNSAAEVSNQGTLAAQNGGAVALLGARVSNTGVIQANLGKVALAGGKAFTLNFDGSGLVNLQVDEAAINAEVRNGNLLRADGGEVLMTARASNTLLSNVVNNTGVIEARTLQNRAGKIVLDAGDNQRVNVAGTLNASAQGSFLGDGGQIEVKGKAVTVALATNVTTAASNGRTGTWKVSAEQLDLSPSASTPVSSGLYSDTVSRNLANTNIELVSTQGDLNANGKINWSSGNKLTLRSDRQNVNLNADLNASGAGAAVNLTAQKQVMLNANLSLSGAGASLALNHEDTTGQGRVVAAGKRVTLSGKGAGFESNGKRYTVIQDVAQLQAVNTNLNGLYVLGNAIDGYGRVFNSIGGNGGAAFSGVFDGLGNNITRLNIQNAGPALGLFANNAGVIGNVNLINSSVTGYANYTGRVEIGSLVGRNTGTVHNATSNATVNAYGSPMNIVGGLIGANTGDVFNSAYTGNVYGNGYTQVLGGLVGENRGVIHASRTDARVYAYYMPRNEIGSGGVGGLVGLNNGGTISGSSAAGAIDARAGVNVGGLVGYAKGGRIIDSQASNSVYATYDSRIGGLVGHNEGGQIVKSSASGKITGVGSSAIGGLVGLNQRGELEDVSATGTVYDTSGASLGGLIGTNNGGNIRTAEARGAVTGGHNSRVGGLIGSNNSGNVSYARASGKVSGWTNSQVGGLVGYNGGNLESVDASGDVSGGNTSRVGGLVGVNSNSENAGRITTAQATGNVRGEYRSIVGGLVGLNQSEIQSSVASGAVSGGVESILGGLVGMNEDGGTVDYSTASSKVNFVNGWRQTYGGLVGWNYGLMRANEVTGNALLVPLYGVNQGTISSYYYF
ncbi:filamentous hemagglutinin N-terminal domain-containing protein [Chromobacterium sp. Rain0013]|uniref:two-partner secretion domain-containing protein n=1 Tax=Chromobacterium sp. Rain0013 TaxID=2292447 RepID=UPI0018884A24|nr:GLUG motif-containing protein [Chromobacterium sp. Rain0013]QOZ82104.1 filamentous hemagglutinin N-terminal domain-containing protein [Chromobacterium sp. Rain0013]